MIFKKIIPPHHKLSPTSIRYFYNHSKIYYIKIIIFHIQIINYQIAMLIYPNDQSLNAIVMIIIVTKNKY